MYKPKVDRQSIAMNLRQHIEEQLSPQCNTIDRYANAMDISTKKLQRLLSEEGTSFSKVLNDYRAQRSMELLEKTSLPMQTIAKKLGYSSSEAFNTACKRWYHHSPRTLRQKASKLR